MMGVTIKFAVSDRLFVKGGLGQIEKSIICY